MPQILIEPPLTVAEYLQGEKAAAVRHDYVNGAVLAINRRETGRDLEVYGKRQGFHLATIDGELSVDAIYKDILSA